MKNYLVSGLAILCLLAGIGGMTASAQIDSDETVKANIPFAFVVGDHTLPAGKYSIKVSDDTDLNLLVLRNARGDKAVFIQTQDVVANRTPRRTELVFNKVGDTYFLSQIWVAGIDSGDEVERSKAERKLEGGGTKRERHSVIAQGRLSKSARKVGATK